ncbi:MAG: sensory histidine kinase AtoS [Methanoregulaceae archaeon PtaB.Bin152]|nr:MAG: sensory histidine kinase AtoS [Methanoregulaceae archaeon PtaB.Bin152]
MTENESPRKDSRLPFYVVCGVFIFLVIGAGVIFYQSQEQQAKETVHHELVSIGTLKAGEIARWREERLYDARTLSRSPFFIDGVRQYLAEPDPAKEENILMRFREINGSVHYHNVMLVDPRGTIRISLDPSVNTVAPDLLASLDVSLATGDAVMTDLHLLPGTTHPHMDVVAPLIISGDGGREPVGAVILSIDPDNYLYPLIQSWPLPSQSAETLLVRREGDRVLFLNDLRHQPHTALNLTIPLTETDVPAVMAVMGRTGAFEGRDYRGVEVISVLEPIPSSPWFIVAKIDRWEAFSGWEAQSVLIFVLGTGLLAGMLLVTGWVWQRRQRYYYQALYEVEAEKYREEQLNSERMDALLQIAGMESATEQELADYAMDAACRLTGSTLAFIGKMSPDESVFDLIAWSQGTMAECAVPGAPVHFPVTWAGIWADAVRRRQPITVNEYDAPLAGKKGLPPGHVPIKRFVSVPIFEGQRVVMICAVANKEMEYTPEDIDQLVLLMQGVWGHYQKRAAAESLQKKHTDLEAAYEEITATQEELQANYEELSRSQRALDESERRYRNLYRFAQVGLFETSLKDATVVACNQRYCELFGFPNVDEAIGKDVLSLYADPAERQEVSRILHEQGHIENYVVRFRNKATGRPFWGQFSARLDREKDVAEGTIIDITAQKEAEAQLRETNAYLNNLFDYANAPIIVWDPQFRITRFNHAFERLTGCRSDAVIGKDVKVLFPERTKEQSMTHLQQAMTGERLETVEIPILRKDGDERIVLWNSATLYADDGRTVIAAIAQGQDITERKAMEKALRESEERYREFFNTSRDAVFITTRDGKWIDFNNASLEIFGYLSREELMALPLPELYEHPEERDAFLALIDEEGFVKEHPVRLRKKDGTVIDTLITAVSVTDAGGVARSFIGSIRDITEKKRAEEALRESERKFRDTIHNLDEGFYRCTLDGILLEYNPSFVNILSLDLKKDYRGTMLPDFWVNREEREVYLSRLLQEGAIRNYMIRAKKAGGEEIFVLTNAHLVYDARQKPVSIEGTFLDITDRKRMEDALEKSERELRALFRSMINAFALFESVFDEEGRFISYRFVYINDAYERITGVTFEGVRGKTVHEVWPDTEQSWVEAYGRVAMTGEPRSFDMYHAPTKKIYHCNVYRPGESRDRFCVVFEDITDRKRAEEEREGLISVLEQKNAELERFTYTVSHDLRSPLITIRGFAELIEDDVLKGDMPRVHDDISRITSAADKMQSLLSDLLNLSRIGRLVNPSENVSLGTIIGEAVDLLAGPLREHKVRVEIAPDLPLVHVDHIRIREVYTNLIENAIKFTRGHSDPEIVIGMREEIGGKVFFVRDNGIGIEPRYLSKIFGLFEKLDGRSEGTGIGLAIVKRIIEVHGGRIWAESEGPGKGTTICFTLPVASGGHSQE